VRSRSSGKGKSQRRKISRARLPDLATQISAAAKRAVFLESAYRSKPLIDDDTFQEHKRKIQEDYRVDVLCPELTYLASRRLRTEHQWVWQRIARKFAALLDEQQKERKALLAEPVWDLPRSYSEVVDLLKKQRIDAPTPRFEASAEFEEHRQRFEAEAQWLFDRMRRMPRHEPTSRRRRSSGPKFDLLLAVVAANVAAWTTRGTGARDWHATVRIMECHGWDLGRLSIKGKAEQLEDRVRKAHKRGLLRGFARDSPS
jgi:hypothetical protein